METVLSVPVTGVRPRRWRLGALFDNPWMALAVPLLVPLATLFL